MLIYMAKKTIDYLLNSVIDVVAKMGIRETMTTLLEEHQTKFIGSLREVRVQDRLSLLAANYTKLPQRWTKWGEYNVHYNTLKI